jgi:integrase
MSIRKRGWFTAKEIGEEADTLGLDLGETGARAKAVASLKAKGREMSTAYVVDYSAYSAKKEKVVRCFKTFERKKAAEDFWHSVAGAKSKPSADARNVRVRDAAETWFEAVRVGRSGRLPAEGSTLRQYRTHIDLHIVPELGNDKLSDLTATRVRGFRDHLLKTLSRAMARKVLTSFKSILREAHAHDLMSSNPAAGVSIQGNGNGRHRKEVAIPERKEIAAVLRFVEHLATQPNKQRAKTWRRWRAFIMTAIYTGLRASELRGLPWEAVDLKAGTITVMQRADENGKIGEPKSGSSRRTVAIPPSLVAILREWKLEVPKGKLGLVFPNWQGNVEGLGNIHNRCWKPLQERAGLRCKHNFHSLRHFRASLLIADGANPKEVQAELGHATIAVTYDLYAHLFKDETADKVRKARAARLADTLTSM